MERKNHLALYIQERRTSRNITYLAPAGKTTWGHSFCTISNHARETSTCLPHRPGWTGIIFPFLQHYRHPTTLCLSPPEHTFAGHGRGLSDIPTQHNRHPYKMPKLSLRLAGLHRDHRRVASEAPSLLQYFGFNGQPELPRPSSLTTTPLEPSQTQT